MINYSPTINLNYSKVAVDGYFLYPPFFSMLNLKFKGRSYDYVRQCLETFITIQQDLTFLLEDYFGATHRQIEHLLQQLQHFERKPDLTLRRCLSLSINGRIYNSYPYQETLEAMDTYEKAVLYILICE